MNKETRRHLAFFSILFVVFIILVLALSGFDISNIRIYKGIHLG